VQKVVNPLEIPHCGAEPSLGGHRAQAFLPRAGERPLHTLADQPGGQEIPHQPVPQLVKVGHLTNP
jgi:hypothetical protein